MKRILFSLIIAVLAASALHAQSTVVCGAVLDSLTRQGEPAAVVQFFKVPDTEKPVAFTTTDADGKFCQRLTGAGEYVLLYSGIGRQDRRLSFKLGEEESFNLGEIGIRERYTRDLPATIALASLAGKHVAEHASLLEDIKVPAAHLWRGNGITGCVTSWKTSCPICPTNTPFTTRAGGAAPVCIS